MSRNASGVESCSPGWADVTQGGKIRWKMQGLARLANQPVRETLPLQGSRDRSAGVLLLHDTTSNRKVKLRSTESRSRGGFSVPTETLPRIDPPSDQSCTPFESPAARPPAAACDSTPVPVLDPSPLSSTSRHRSLPSFPDALQVVKAAAPGEESVTHSSCRIPQHTAVIPCIGQTRHSQQQQQQQ